MPKIRKRPLLDAASNVPEINAGEKLSKGNGNKGKGISKQISKYREDEVRTTVARKTDLDVKRPGSGRRTLRRRNNESAVSYVENGSGSDDSGSDSDFKLQGKVSADSSEDSLDAAKDREVISVGRKRRKTDMSESATKTKGGRVHSDESPDSNSPFQIDDLEINLSEASSDSDGSMGDESKGACSTVKSTAQKFSSVSKPDGLLKINAKKEAVEIFKTDTKQNSPLVSSPSNYFAVNLEHIRKTNLSILPGVPDIEAKTLVNGHNEMECLSDDEDDALPQSVKKENFVTKRKGRKSAKSQNETKSTSGKPKNARGKKVLKSKEVVSSNEAKHSLLASCEKTLIAEKMKTLSSDLTVFPEIKLDSEVNNICFITDTSEYKTEVKPDIKTLGDKNVPKKITRNKVKKPNKLPEKTTNTVKKAEKSKRTMKQSAATSSSETEKDHSVTKGDKSTTTKQNSKGNKSGVARGKGLTKKTLASDSENDAEMKSGEKIVSSSESEWEDVSEDENAALDDYNPAIPKEGVEIILNSELAHHKRKKKKTFDMQAFIRRRINQIKRDVQISKHKVHLLCLLAHGIYINNLVRQDVFVGITLSLLPYEFSSYFSKKLTLGDLKKLITIYRSYFTFKNNLFVVRDLADALTAGLQERQANNSREFVLLFIAILHCLKLRTRLCLSLYPVPLKPVDLLKYANRETITLDDSDEELIKASQVPEDKVKDEPANTKGNVKQTKNNSRSKSDTDKTKKGKAKSKSEVTKDTSEESKTRKSNRTRSSTKKGTNPHNESSDSDFQEDNVVDISVSSDSDFEVKKKPKARKKCEETETFQKKSRRSSAPKDKAKAPERSNKVGGKIMEEWPEVFCGTEKRWVPIQIFDGTCDKIGEIESVLREPIRYILSFDDKGFVKDLTKKYASGWLTTVRKSRVNENWWEESLEPFSPPDTEDNRAEEQLIQATLQEQPFPKTVGQFKNHPLYVLERHLLKFEAIYPPDAPPLGFIRQEPIYARECVHTLRSRETWVRHARVVKVGEEPYKIVKSRPKWNRMTKTMITDQPLPVFGVWQTEEYVPPEAKDGKVPRNAYGNVELFKMSMLPKGTVYLQAPGLNRVAKKLGIDCSPALVGFEGQCYTVRPVYDGWVVCEEFQETLMAAWEEEQINIEKREEEKREKRIYGNWKKLIRGLLIRESVKAKYLSESCN